MFAIQKYFPASFAFSKAIYILNGVLVLMLAASISLWSGFFLKRAKNVPSGLQQPSQTNQQNAPRFDLDQLLARPVFGSAQTQVNDNRFENIPLSSLNLKLTGVVSGDRGGIALISIGGQPQAPFFVGEVVAPNTVLDAVLSNRVILLRSGVRESLLLEDENPPLNISGNSGVTNQSQDISGNSPKMISNGSTMSYGKIRKETIAKYAAVKPQSQQPTRQVAIIPGPKGGFVVRDVQAGSIFEKMGLRKGDIIETFNGVPLKTMQDVMKLYQATSDTAALKTASAEVKRGNERKKLHYQQ